MSTGETLAAINLTISASTERQWQGIRRPRGPSPRADVQPSQWDDADWDHDHDEAAGHRARRLLSRSNSGFHRFGDRLGGVAPMARRRTLGKAPRHRDRGPDGDLRRLLRRAVVAARRRPDQSRNGDAMAGGGDRGKYRPRQHRRGRRHADRARRADPHRRAYPRHHRPGSRPCHRGERAESRGEAVGHRAVDGTASRRKPQSGGCRTRGADHAGWLRHRFHRRQRKAARHRRCLEEAGRHRADISASDSPARRLPRRLRLHPPLHRPPRRGSRQRAKRIAGRPRLARQPEPDRA